MHSVYSYELVKSKIAVHSLTTWVFGTLHQGHHVESVSSCRRHVQLVNSSHIVSTGAYEISSGIHG